MEKKKKPAARMENKKRPAARMEKKKKPAARADDQAVRHMDVRRALGVITRGFVLCMFVIHALSISGNYMQIRYKQRVYVLLLTLMAAATLLVLFYQAAQGRRPGFGFKKWAKCIKIHEYMLLGYWAVMLLSALLSPYQENVWLGVTRPEGFWLQSAYIASFFMISRFYKPDERDMLVYVSVMALISVYGVFQYYGLDFLELAPEEFYGPKLLLFSTINNRNVASTLLVMAFGFGVVMFTQKSKKRDWAYFVCALILFYALLITDTESGYVGLLLAGALSLALLVRDRHMAARLCALFACFFALLFINGSVYPLLQTGWEGWFAPWPFGGLLAIAPYAAGAFAAAAALFKFLKVKTPKISGKVWRRGWPVLFIALLVLLCACMPVIAGATQLRSFDELNEMLHGNIEDTFMSNRAYIWSRALTLVPDRPLIGHGPDAFEAAFKVFYDESAELFGVYFDKAHSEWVQALVDVGALGFAALMGFYGALFYAARKKTGNTFTLALGFAMLVYVIQAAFNFATPVAHPIVWTVWGVFGARIQNDDESELPAI
ncbi:MAG: O-antigen ligase family protein [Clostridiales bacterium]|jgi:O-antigen ligase|nr:O-antigen ligase family protein [Clostridiales bacterium]